jgi:hypothetical protein
MCTLKKNLEGLTKNSCWFDVEKTVAKADVTYIWNQLLCNGFPYLVGSFSTSTIGSIFPWIVFRAFVQAKFLLPCCCKGHGFDTQLDTIEISGLKGGEPIFTTPIAILSLGRFIGGIFTLAGVRFVALEKHGFT